MLHTLRLRDFRCYKRLNWDIPPEGALLIGANAQGKTSLIEAICVALTLHSPRASRLDRLALHGAPGFGISLDTDSGTRRLVWQPRRLEMRVNNREERAYADYLVGSPPVTWLGNRDMALVYGPAEQRRDFLDFLGMQWHPLYRSHLQAYRKALRSRNLLLRNPHPRRDVLQSYASVLAEHGEELIRLRLRLLDLLRPHVLQHHRAISGNPLEEVSLHYTAATRDPLIHALENCLENDLRAGCTTLGPHRDDIELRIGGHPAASYASEGQQRTLAVALSLAQASLLYAETGLAPVLLIDDIFGEMDPARRRAMLSALPPDSQAFITTTHLDWLGQSPLPLPVRRIENAALQ